MIQVGRTTDGMGGILAWFDLPRACRADARACTEGMALLDGNMFTNLDLELVARFLSHFIVSSTLIFDFSVLSPFVSQLKHLQLGI